MTDQFPTSDGLLEYCDRLRQDHAPDFRLYIARDENEFYAAAEDALYQAIIQIESGRKQFMSLHEPALSKMLSICLLAAKVATTAEEDNSGHVDITIKHRKGIFVMLGECKRYDGYAYHIKGCEQLLQRYMSGRASRAFCLEFCALPGMYDKLLELKREFDKMRPLKQQNTAWDHANIKGAFLTKHQHSAGSEVELLHVGCNLYHEEVATETPPSTAKPIRKKLAKHKGSG